MHIRCHCHLIAFLLVRVVTLSIAVFVPKAPAVAGEGSVVGNGARAGDNIAPGNGARCGSNPARAGSLTGSDLNGEAAQGGPTAGKKNTGKVFEEVIDLIIDSVPNTNNNDNRNNPNAATITAGPNNRDHKPQRSRLPPSKRHPQPLHGANPRFRRHNQPELPSQLPLLRHNLRSHQLAGAKQLRRPDEQLLQLRDRSSGPLDRRVRRAGSSQPLWACRGRQAECRQRGGGVFVLRDGAQ